MAEILRRLADDFFNPLTPDLILIFSVGTESRVGKHEVVQDFRNGANPNTFPALDSNIKLGVEG